MPSTSAKGFVAPPATQKVSEQAAVQGQQQMVARVVAVYTLSVSVLLIAWLVSVPLGTPIFVQVPFSSGAPVLTIGATVAVGLHVAVYNLTHEVDEAKMTPQVIARLDLFSTVGIIVAVMVATTGWLFVTPVGVTSLSTARGLDLLGLALSVVVVLVACLAGHIVPHSAIRRVDEARHEYNLQWAGRAIAHWSSVGPAGLGAYATFAALLLAPPLLLSLMINGAAWSSVNSGLYWSFLLVLPPALLMISFGLLLHRKYPSSLFVGLVGCGGTLLCPVLVLAELTSRWGWLAVVCVLSAWVVILRSAFSEPRPGRLMIPRIVRAGLLGSLRWRLARMNSTPAETVLTRAASRVGAWFMLATGRTT